MTSPWRDSFEKYFKMALEGEEIVKQISCFINPSAKDRVEQTRQMLGIDCMVSDEEIRKLNLHSSSMNKVSIGVYLLMRKLRLIKEY